MPTEHHKVQSAIAQEAVAWFVRNRGVLLSAEERNKFGRWLRSSPLHVEEYLKTAVMSRNLHAAVNIWEIDLDRLTADARADDGEAVVPLRNDDGPDAACDAGRGIPWRLRVRQIAAVAAACLVLVAVVWVERDGQRFGLSKEFSTARGVQRSWLLPDGSGLNLNSDSAVTVRFNDHERLVQVERGQALFHVAHEPGRRFRVVAGKAGVVAVGTEFDVWRNAGSTRVTVVEGRVAVFTGDVPPATDHALIPAQGVTVSAGEQVQIKDHVLVTKPSLVNVQQAEAWVQHQIAFDQQPLGDVAEQFNQYTSVPIIIQSERLREIPITGVFSNYDTESFVAFISRLDSVEIARAPDRILIVDKSNVSSGQTSH